MYFHGFLERSEALANQLVKGAPAPLCWQAEAMFLVEGTCRGTGPPPASASEDKVQILLRPGEPPFLETRIRVADEDTDWQEPTKFRRQ